MSNQSGSQEETVHAWNEASLASHYADRASSLWPDEWHALASSWSQIAGQAVLDIGIGAGRTTAYLKPVAGQYIGIDISDAMLAEARRRFPDADLRKGDVRKLDFPDQSFSFVMFSFNGIDYINPEERMVALREIHRVLKPGGSFVFSTHNRHVQGERPPEFVPPQIWPTRNPVKLLVRSLRNIGARRRALANYRKLEAHQWVRPEIAWINDSMYEAAFLTCHVTPAEQIRQLQQAGFTSVDLVLDTQGRRCDVNTRDRFFYMRALRAMPLLAAGIQYSSLFAAV